MAGEYQPSEKAVKIVEKIKELTAAPVIRMKRKEGDAQPALTDSKLGGVPYWDLKKAYPVDSAGKNMMMLAQINCSDLSGFDTDLPREGMLQVFIRTDDDLMGLDFDEPASQKDFRVIFHETVDADVTQEQVRALGITAAEENEEYSPVFQTAALSFEAGTDYLNPDVTGFAGVFAEAVKAVTGETIEEEVWYDYFEEEDASYMFDQLSGFAHKIFGYPAFTQTDPRESMTEEEARYYDTLLLQIDSDMGKDGEDYVLWGDCGIANWFINREALKAKDFGRVVYNWDCC